MLDALFIFLTTTLPKAGAQIGGVPLTASVVLLVVAVLRSPFAALRSVAAFRGAAFWYAVLVTVGLIGIVASSDGAEAFSIAQRLVVLASPLAAVAAYRCRVETGVRIVAVGIVLTSLYAVVQFVGGVTATSIQGLTVTFGQSLETKTIGYTSTGDTASKMPSTFQVGNSFGIFVVLAVTLMLVWHPETQRLRRLRVLAIASGVIGLLFCGSRSIIIPVALSLVLVIHQYLATLSRERQHWAMVVIMVAVLFGAVFLTFFRSDVLAAFWDRNVVQTMNDPTASGRTIQWADIWSGILHLNDWQLIRLLLIGQNPSWGLGGEGLPEFFVTFGLPGTVAFYGALAVVARHLWRAPQTRVVSLAVVCVMVAFVVDQSYFYPPNIMNVYLIASLASKMRVGNPSDSRALNDTVYDRDPSLLRGPSDIRARGVREAPCPAIC